MKEQLKPKETLESKVIDVEKEKHNEMLTRMDEMVDLITSVNEFKVVR